MIPGLLFFALALQSANADETPTADDRELSLFEPQVRAAAISRDHREIINLIDLPLRVNSGGRVRTRYYYTIKSVQRNFSQIFTGEIINSMRTGKYEISGSGKGMVGIGEIWFSRPCHAKVCYPEGPGHFRITVINQDN